MRARVELHAAALVLLGAWLLPKVVWPDAWPYRDLFTPAVMFPLSAVLKIALQLLAATGAYACAQRFDPGDRTRRSWRWLGHGMACMCGGQLVLAWWHVGQGVAAPFPSLADALFIPATLILAAALTDFAAAHASAEMEVGSRAQAVRTGAVVVVIAIACLVAPLVLLLRSDAPLGERVLAAGYPLLDVTLLAPAVVVLRQISHLAGGALWRGWIVILVGTIALAAGDLAFAFFSIFEVQRLDPLLDFTFASGYLLIAWGTRIHRAALA